MKIDSITIRGFRGFNHETSIELHPKLTIVYAPNSYGKTSIAEAIEWLLYGETSKVATGRSKTEYKGSYRNCHYTGKSPPCVQIEVLHGEEKQRWISELNENDSRTQYVGQGHQRKRVDKWPLPIDSDHTKPFVHQHDLNHLILVPPKERFEKLARLAGLPELEALLTNMVSFCTKPPLPPEVVQLRNDIDALFRRVKGCDALDTLQAAIEPTPVDLAEIRRAARKQAAPWVGYIADDHRLIAALEEKRREALDSAFGGRIRLDAYSSDETKQTEDAYRQMCMCCGSEFRESYAKLETLRLSKQLQQRVEFLRLGLGLLPQKPGKCPFCAKPLTPEEEQQIRGEHERAVEQADTDPVEATRNWIAGAIDNAMKALDTHLEQYKAKTQDLMLLEQSLGNLREKLPAESAPHIDLLSQAATAIGEGHDQLLKRAEQARKAAKDLQRSIDDCETDPSLVQDLARCVGAYITAAKENENALAKWAPQVTRVSKILREDLDKLAGIEDIGILISFIEKEHKIRKKIQIDKILDSLSDLRQVVQTYVGEHIKECVEHSLASKVNEWYQSIKTSTDPDVHFSGFSVELTKQGTAKRQIAIRATSYGKELASAVSCLSESKLNALALCVSICANVDPESPFDFLVIDDPIQTLDTQHAMQFAEIIRDLVSKHNKQVLLLSHNNTWVRQTRSTCSSVDGTYLEITGYSLEGPQIAYQPWVPWKERLSNIDARIKNPNASSQDLEQTEADMRMAFYEIISEGYLKLKNVRKPAHRLNVANAKKLLLECGVKDALIDRVKAALVTVDDAHHDPPDYSACRERLRQHYSLAHQLAQSFDLK